MRIQLGVATQTFEENGHTHACNLETTYAKLRIEAWKAVYSNHCKVCLGAGGKSYPATRDDPGEFDPCTCIMNALCPRCGGYNILWNEEEDAYNPDAHCDHCGWVPTGYKHAHDICPEYTECNCLDIQSELLDEAASLFRPESYAHRLPSPYDGTFFDE